jgi:hypothetical protein
MLYQIIPCAPPPHTHTPQIRGIKTNIPFMENVLRHPVFLNGTATTGFIETYSKDLFKFEGHSNIRANKLLLYLPRRRGGGGGGGDGWSSFVEEDGEEGGAVGLVLFTQYQPLQAPSTAHQHLCPRVFAHTDLCYILHGVSVHVYIGGQHGWSYTSLHTCAIFTFNAPLCRS